MDKVLLNHYKLMNKDIALIEFTLYSTVKTGFGTSETVYFLEIDKVHEKHSNMFPKNAPHGFNNNNLLEWIKKRKAPRNRAFIEKVFDSIDDSPNPLKYVDITHALSLNDSFWIDNDIAPTKWSSCNLYRHPFNTLLAQVAFTGYSHKISGLITSPEVTSNGAQKKCWLNRPDGIYLMKGDSFFRNSDNRSQATSEFYAAQIAATMGIEHINYDLEEFNHDSNSRETVCLCKLFTSEDIGFVDAYTYFKAKHLNIDNRDESDIAYHVELANAFGLEKYEDMMVLDSLILNKDRHLGNFGFLVDNNTGKFLRPAPVFDNGYSLLCNEAVADFKKYKDDVPALINQSPSGKFLNFDTAAKWFVQPRHIPALRKLVNFKFKRHPEPACNISEESLAVLEKVVQSRARCLLEINKEKGPHKSLRLSRSKLPDDEHQM